MGYLTMPKRVLAYVLMVFVILASLRYVELWRHPKGVLSQSDNRPLQPSDSLASVGLVVSSKSTDDTSWIYSPFSKWDKFVYVLDDDGAVLSVPANKGQSAMAYLTYIIDHYDDLHDLTIFHHASRYQWHNDDPQYDALRLLSQLNIPYVMSKGYHNLRCVWKLGCGHDAIHLDSTLSHALRDEAVPSPKLGGTVNKRQQQSETDLDFIADGDETEHYDEMTGGDQDWTLADDTDDSEKNDEMNGGDHDADVTSDVAIAPTGADVDTGNDDIVASASSTSSTLSTWTTSVSPSASISSSAQPTSTTARDTAFDFPADHSATKADGEGPKATPSQSSTSQNPAVAPSQAASSQAVNSHRPIPTIPVGPSQPWDKNATFRHAFQVLLPGTPLPHSIAAPCCAQFAVTRGVIRQRPKAHYERYRDWIMATDLDDTISSRVMEKLWHIIFGRPANDCPDAPACYCSLYGLCNLECENNRSCWSQWSSPGHVANNDNLDAP